MNIAYSVKEINTPIARGSCVTLGNFDGVHLGHRSIITHMCKRAKECELTSVLVTFYPHPLAVIGTPPPIISPLSLRLEIIESLGVDLALVLPFTKETASIEAEEFVHKILADSLSSREVVLGYNSFFGKGRRGSAMLLSQMGKNLGFCVEQMPPIMHGGAAVSSTRVRRTIAAGDVKIASELLGRLHTVKGLVVEGRKLGRKLGFPTLNIREKDAEGHLSLASELCGLLPSTGVYAVWLEHDGRLHRAVANIGTNPTFEESMGSLPITLEVHVFDFKQEIYGEAVRVHFVEKLRDERRFNGPDELIKAIKEDVNLAGKIFEKADAGQVFRAKLI